MNHVQCLEQSIFIYLNLLSTISDLYEMFYRIFLSLSTFACVKEFPRIKENKNRGITKK